MIMSQRMLLLQIKRAYSCSTFWFDQPCKRWKKMGSYQSSKKWGLQQCEEQSTNVMSTPHTLWLLKASTRTASRFPTCEMKQPRLSRKSK